MTEPRDRSASSWNDRRGGQVRIWRKPPRTLDRRS